MKQMNHKKSLKEAVRSYFKENASIFAGALLMMHGTPILYSRFSFVK